MVKKVRLRNFSGDHLKDFLEQYNADKVNTQPNTEKELLSLYFNYTDPLLTYVRELNSDNVFSLGNEARAMFGHIADYRLESGARKNLSDAYGHFRRLNIDSFKIICNKFDECLFSYLLHHFHYDYRKVQESFLKDYSSKYFNAQKLYLDAQKKERTGSDRVSENIIAAYYDAANAYVDLFVFLQSSYKKIDKTKSKAILSLWFKLLVSGAGVLLSIVTELGIHV